MNDYDLENERKLPISKKSPKKPREEFD